MKILVAPLNWGLGHASRCVPIIRRLCREGHQVVLGGDGDALLYLQQHFPQLRAIELAQLNLFYSKSNRQVLAMLIALPKLIAFSIRDHRLLRRIQSEEHFDRIISDNRFGLFFHHPTIDGSHTLHNPSCTVRTIYITHQLHIMFPYPYKWMEPFASFVHARIYRKYSEVWIPDTPDHRLSGELSRPVACRLSPVAVKYIGPLSRFSKEEALPLPLEEGLEVKPVVALFSGLEPHRTFFEQAVLERYKGHIENVLLVNGKLDKQFTDSELAYYLTHAEKIIARSGYSTIMDLDALGVLNKAELIPTPGQPEQEYLAKYFAENKGLFEKK